MAMQSSYYTVPWPNVANTMVGTPSLSNVGAIDASGEYDAMVFRATAAMTISHVTFRCPSASGSPTCEVRIETVGTDGLPSGTLWATNTTGTSGTLSTNSNPLIALTASATIARNDIFAVVLKYASGTSFQSARIANVQTNLGDPYAVLNQGTPTKTAAQAARTLGLGSSSTSFYAIPGCLPISAITANTFDNTNSAARGLRFSLPFKATLSGLTWFNATSTGDYSIKLYADDGTTELATSAVFDGDQMLNSNSGNPRARFTTPYDLVAGTTYRAVILPNTATTVNLTTITFASADYKGASPWGSTAQYVTRASGTWDTSLTTQIPLMDLLLSHFPESDGGGAHFSATMSG